MIEFAVYEAKIIYLLDELRTLLEKGNKIIFKLLSLQDRKKAKRKQLHETEENLLKQLQETTVKALHTVEELDKIIDINILFEHPKDVSSKIQVITSKAIQANTNYVFLQKENKTIIYEDNRATDLRSNMKHLANKIELYNSNFGEKLTTFKQARENYMKALQESVDSLDF